MMMSAGLLMATLLDEGLSIASTYLQPALNLVVCLINLFVLMPKLKVRKCEQRKENLHLHLHEKQAQGRQSGASTLVDVDYGQIQQFLH